MAERRMFAKNIIDSDVFLDMPVTARLLYYDLSMRADDDGFVNSPKKIMRIVGAVDDDLKILITKQFVIPFQTGIVVIRHWKIHNYIQKDRYKETVYKNEKEQLYIDNTGIYQPLDTEWIQNVSKSETQVRIGKSKSKDRDNIKAIEASPADSTRPNKAESQNHSEDKPKTVKQYFDDEKVNDAFVEFISDRKERKKAMTSRAIEMAVNKIKQLSNDDSELAVKIIHQSIANGWTGLFPLTTDQRTPPKAKQTPFNDFHQRDYDFEALERKLLNKMERKDQS